MPVPQGLSSHFCEPAARKSRMLCRDGERAERLDGVNTKKNVPVAQVLADGFEVGAESGQEMVAGQRDQPGLFVHLAHDIHRPDFSQFADIHQADLDALFRQRHPGIDIGGIVVEVDEDIVALAPGQPGGGHAQRQRRRPEKRDLLRLRPDQARRQFARLLEARKREGRILGALRALQGVIAHRLGHPAREGLLAEWAR